MTAFYMNTSAIAKRYLTEIGTAWVQSLINPSLGNVLVVCEITPIEFSSVLARRHREGYLTGTDVLQLEAMYDNHHTNEYLFVPLDNDVMLLARQLVQRHTLRTLDALHLASALETSRILGVTPIFVTSDKHLLAAAAGEGVSTDNPLNHP